MSRKEDLQGLIDLCKTQRDVASKKTHYHRLNEWTDIIGTYIRDMLDKHGFVNGEPEINKTKPEVVYWWYKVYSTWSNIYLSRHLQTSVALHHSSAWERNEALIKTLEEWMEDLTKEQPCH